MPDSAPPPPEYPQQPQYDPYQGQGPYQQVPQNDQKAVWSLVLGIMSLICCGIFAAIPAVILGHMSVKDIDQSGGWLTGKEMAVAGMVMGYIIVAITILIIIAYIIFGIAMFGMFGAIAQQQGY